MPRISFAELKAEFKRVLIKKGCDEATADLSAQLIAETSCDGVYSHGVNRFPRVVEYIDKGYIDLKAKPTLTDAMGALPVLPMSEVVTSYYLRLRVADQAGVLAKVTGLLAEAGVSIDAVLQREADEVGGEGSTQTDLIILTHDAREGAMNAAQAKLQALPSVLAPIVRIRKEELN